MHSLLRLSGCFSCILIKIKIVIVKIVVKNVIVVIEVDVRVGKDDTISIEINVVGNVEFSESNILKSFNVISI